MFFSLCKKPDDLFELKRYIARKKSSIVSCVNPGFSFVQYFELNLLARAEDDNRLQVRPCCQDVLVSNYKIGAHNKIAFQSKPLVYHVYLVTIRQLFFHDQQGTKWPVILMVTSISNGPPKSTFLPLVQQLQESRRVAIPAGCMGRKPLHMPTPVVWQRAGQPVRGTKACWALQGTSGLSCGTHTSYHGNGL